MTVFCNLNNLQKGIWWSAVRPIPGQSWVYITTPFLEEWKFGRGIRINLIWVLNLFVSLSEKEAVSRSIYYYCFGRCLVFFRLVSVQLRDVHRHFVGLCWPCVVVSRPNKVYLPNGISRVCSSQIFLILLNNKKKSSMLTLLGQGNNFQTEYWYNIQRPGVRFSIVPITFQAPKAVYACCVYIFGLKNYTIKPSFNRQNWPVCELGTVLLFDRFWFENLPSASKSYRNFREKGSRAEKGGEGGGKWHALV